MKFLSTLLLSVGLMAGTSLFAQKAQEVTFGLISWLPMKVQALLQEHNRLHPDRKIIASFNGHTHVDYAENIEGIWYISTTSMAYHWLGEDYGHIRYSAEVDKDYRWIKYTAPFKEPLFTTVTISSNDQDCWQKN